MAAWLQKTILTLVVLGAHAGLAGAANPYPSKPIRWVVPWPAGGVADTQARIIAEQLGKALGQPLLIDNRAGASGTPRRCHARTKVTKPGAVRKAPRRTTALSPPTPCVANCGRTIVYCVTEALTVNYVYRSSGCAR